MESIVLDPLGVVNTDGTPVNPATDESVLLLRRIVKMLESSAVVDFQNRQRITIEAIAPASFSFLGVAVVGANYPTGGAPTLSSTSYPIGVWEMPVDQRWRIISDARHAYEAGIRSHITWSS